MRILLSGCALFAIAFVLHLLIWRIKLPKRHTPALLGIFFAVLSLWVAGTAVQGAPLWDTLHIALFFISVSLCYVITYSAVEGDSPTLSLMRFLAEKRNEGRSEGEVIAFFAKRPFIKARLNALRHSAFIKEENGRLFLAGRPSIPFQLILAFRKVYGEIPKGG